MKKIDTPHKQHGFTLVEIMIAITIGLVMLAGVLQISQANKTSSRLQRNMGFVQENMRSAMDVLTRDIRLTGFALVAPAPVLFTNVSAAATTDDAAPVTADSGNADSDQITLSYVADTDCLGQATPPGDRFAINHYFIRDQSLMCRGNGGLRPLALVDGVENLQILYGEDTDADPEFSANHYVRADQVVNMANVVSVRIGMRFVSPENVRDAIDTNAYALLGAAPSFTPNDRRLRREITTTVSLRNNNFL